MRLMYSFICERKEVACVRKNEKDIVYGEMSQTEITSQTNVVGSLGTSIVVIYFRKYEHKIDVKTCSNDTKNVELFKPGERCLSQ